MNVVVAALSAPAHLNGVSRHAIGLVRTLPTTRAVADSLPGKATWSIRIPTRFARR
jgi:hypothetical protein